MNEMNVRTRASGAGNENIERTIKLIFRKLPFILIISVVALLIGLGLAYRNYSPQYTARCTIMILRYENPDENNSNNNNQFLLFRAVY